ncbi:hypothetical protein C5167_007269 [Papaver somniferum]|uniref:cyclic dof factor 4-like n=1 Tax=Papaver somniferum TaxID=3469 RepID=UPI000E6FBD74|nr:cyclic dof factor 4-like [Papaver somniferum]RZC93455.1 hypothetical protein C5167_007269 [Papaver somniferum]
MAQVDNNISRQPTTTGFKLFGTTIPLETTKQVQAAVVKKEAEEIIKSSSSSSPSSSTTSSSGEVPAERKISEKIIPCPRCKSMETKFCYFNNYNVNQPRHFCKGCQRYWTAGGTLRNVPVGAGRRKAKPSGFSSTGHDHCIFDASGVGELDIHGMVQQWQHMTTVSRDSGGAFQHVFPGKRRNTNPTGQIC